MAYALTVFCWAANTDYKWGVWVGIKGGRRKMAIFKYYLCAPYYYVPTIFLIRLKGKILWKEDKNVSLFTNQMFGPLQTETLLYWKTYSRDAINSYIHTILFKNQVNARKWHKTHFERVYLLLI